MSKITATNNSTVAFYKLPVGGQATPAGSSRDIPLSSSPLNIYLS
jgi:hypothetical protein